MSRKINRRALAAALDSLDAQSGGGGGTVFNTPLSTRTDAPAPHWDDRPHHHSNFGLDILGGVGNVLSTPLSAVTSTLKEFSDQSQQGTDPSQHASFSDWWNQIYHPSQRLMTSDFIFGNEAKGIKGTGLEKKIKNPWQRLAVSLPGDIALDPLTYVAPAGLAKHGNEAVAREVAQSAARQAAAVGGEEGASILERGAEAAAKARRTGVSKLSRQEIADFLTREGTSKPLAKRGLQFANLATIPGTDRGPLAAAGEAFASGKAALADKVLAGPIGKTFQKDRELLQAARSGNPTKAWEGIFGRMVHETAQSVGGHTGRTWVGQLNNVTKGFTKEDWAQLPRALEGDAAALKYLGDRATPVRDLLDAAHAHLVEHGANINRLADYSPRQITEQGQKILDQLGAGGRRGHGFQPLAWFEKARSLQPQEDGLYHFLGDTFEATTNADVTANVNRIAREKLAAVDPKAAEEMAGFFNPDAKQALTYYFRRAANRAAQMDAAQHLHDVGIGGIARTAVTDPEAQKLANELAQKIPAMEQQGVTLGEHAGQFDQAAQDLQQHLAGQRVGQLEQSLSGAPVTSPLTDAQDVGLAAAGTRDAQAAVTDAQAQLDVLRAADVKRASYRSAAAQNLSDEIARLQVELATASDPGRIAAATQRVQELASEHAAWTTRRDAALAAAIPDTVMPKGWRTSLDQFGNATARPVGGFKVTPEKTLLHAGAAESAAQGTAKMLNDLTGAVAALKGAGGNPTAIGDALTTILSAAHPGASIQEIKDLVGSLTVPMGNNTWMLTKEGDQLVGSLTKALQTEAKRTEQELAAAAKLAERSVRNGKNGLVIGDVYHSTSQRWTTDVPSGTASAHDTLDLPGLNTSNDQTGEIALGNPLLTEGEQHGYAIGERGGTRRNVQAPEVRSYGVRDPANTVLLPVDRPIGLEDISPTTHQFVDNFYNGQDWMDEFQPPHTGHDGLDNIVAHDPIAAAIIGDAGQFLDGLGIPTPAGYQDVTDYLAANYEHLVGDNPARGVAGAHQAMRNMLDNALGDGAPQAVADYVNHLYDNLGIKGLTREGGQITGRGVPHNHFIWFRPNEDLELLGKADFTAAYAEKQVRELSKEHTFFSDVLRKPEQIQERIANREANLKAYGKTPGAVRATPATRRAEQAVQFAQDSATRAEQYMNDTVDAIMARRADHLAELRKLTSYLNSGAPMPDEMRSSLQAMVDDLHQAVQWGHVHERALNVADEQLKRISTLEQSAAEARAAASDLHQGVVDLQSQIGKLEQQKIDLISQAVKDGIQIEIKHGIGTPKQLADVLLHTNKVQDVTGLLKYYDRAVNWIKSYQIATPGFHVRNSMGGVFNNALGDVDLSSYPEFFRMAKLAKAGKLEGKQLELFRTAEQAIGHGQIGSEGILRAAEGGGPARINLWVRGSQGLGERVEYNLRGVMAYDVLKKGGSLDDAVAMVHRYHFNYSDLADFEQKYIRRVMPFYTWTRKNLPLQIEMIQRNPKVYARFFHLKNEIERMSSEDPMTPPYFKDLMAVRLPWERGGGHVYWTPDLPPRDLQKLADPFRESVSMLTPVIKTPIEMWAGKQFFKDLPLSDSKFVPAPMPALLIRGVGPALEAMHLAERKDGTYFMSEKNAYALEQFVPLIARYRRLLPSESKYEKKQMTSLLSTLGFGARTNTSDEQQAYLKSQEFAAKDAAKRRRALQKAADALKNG